MLFWDLRILQEFAGALGLKKILKNSKKTLDFI